MYFCRLQVHQSRTAQQTTTARATLSVVTITAAGISALGVILAAVDTASQATVRNGRPAATVTRTAGDLSSVEKRLVAALTDSTAVPEVYRTEREHD